MSFADLGLSAVLAQRVAELGYAAPTPIQAEAIPAILAGRDLLAAARTGSGKTAAFALPLLHRLAAGSRAAAARPAALVLVPTRELAEQVAGVLEQYGQGSYLSVQRVFGGESLTRQASGLAMGVDVLVATPGRLLDFIRRDLIDLSAVQMLVLDEADRMLDLGFARDLADVAAALPRVRQTLCFSATFSEPVRRLAKQWLRDPLDIAAGSDKGAEKAAGQRGDAPLATTAAKAAPVRLPPGLTHGLIAADKKRKPALLRRLLTTRDWPQVLVFANTRQSVDEVTAWLQSSGLAADALHGDRPQRERQAVLAAFAAGELRILIATDVAARGLDIAGLPAVINLDLPVAAADYVHRIGRTGRAGAAGEALSLVSADEAPRLAAIEALLGKPLPRDEEPGFEPRQPLPDRPRALPAAKPVGGRSPAPAGGKPGAPGRKPGGSAASHAGKKSGAPGKSPGRPAGSGTKPAGPRGPARGGRR